MSHESFDEKVKIMTCSFINVSVDRYWWYWYVADAAPVSDPPKEP